MVFRYLTITLNKNLQSNKLKTREDIFKFIGEEDAKLFTNVVNHLLGVQQNIGVLVQELSTGSINGLINSKDSLESVIGTLIYVQRLLETRLLKEKEGGEIRLKKTKKTTKKSTKGCK